MTTPEKIMEQAQVFASSWALVGTRFDSGDEIENATEQKDSLGQIVKALTAERDEYRKAADTMAAAHKVERDALLLANRDLSNWFDALKADHDALLVAGKLALEALDGYLDWDGGHAPDKPAFDAITALKAAEVK